MTTITKEWLQQTIAEFENTRDDIPFGLDDDDAKILIVLKRALASLEREQVRHEHADWSDATFGDVGPIGPLKHLSKEALETAAEPGDLSEWADMQFLLWDAQRHAGITDKQITLAMVEKLAVNKKRKWPEPKDGEPRLHIKEQSVPVVRQIMRELVSLLDEDQFARIENIALSAGVMPPQPVPVVPEEIEPDSNNTYDYVDGWNACRAALLQGAEPVSQTYELPELIEGMEVSVDVSTCDFDAGHRYFGTVTEVSELDTAKNGYILLVQDAEPNFKTAGNSPAIPGGWISCSERMPENGQECLVQTNSGWRYVSFYDAHSRLFYDSPKGDIEYILVTHWMPVPAAPEPEQS